MRTITELWTERATQNGKGAEYVAANKAKFPPDYALTLNWGIANMAPSVFDAEKDAEWNEHKCYRELMGVWKTRVDAVIERIKKSDKQQAIRILALLKRIEDEAPSSELLGLYATYKPIVDSASDAAAAAVQTQLLVEEDSELKLQEVAKRFYKVKHSGKAVLYDVNLDEWTWYDDCKKHFGHLKVQIHNPDTNRTHTKNVFDAFLEWDKAPRYDRVTFNPRHDGHYYNEEKQISNFNLWTGILVKPQPGEDDLLFWELLQRICNYNDEYFDYVQKWLAHMVQKPWELPGTMLGISGIQGLGKNAWIETIGMLFSTLEMINHMRDKDDDIIGKVLGTGAFGIFTSYEEVFGHFNALAGNKLLLFMDEATWGGYHDQKARLKTAITGQNVTINDKFMKELPVKNYRRFIIASNEGYYYGADASDRRLLPLEFKEQNRPTDEWFDMFYNTRRNGKMLENLLDRLQKVDIKDWSPMKALRNMEIVTGAAIQLGSAPDYQRWLADMAETGTYNVPGDKETGEYTFDACGHFVKEDDLRRSYQLYSGSKDMKGWNKADFVEVRDTVLGEKQQRKVGRGRNIPSQIEMQERLKAQYKWKWLKFSPIQDPGDVKKSEKVIELRKKILGM